MKAELNPGEVLVTLSRRNLLALLRSLEWFALPGEIQALRVYVDGELSDNVVLRVRSEADHTHYLHREPPGLMNPLTEAFIAAAEESSRFMEQLLARGREAEDEFEGALEANSEHGGDADVSTDESTKGADQ